MNCSQFNYNFIKGMKCKQIIHGNCHIAHLSLYFNLFKYFLKLHFLSLLFATT